MDLYKWYVILDWIAIKNEQQPQPQPQPQRMNKFAEL